MAGLIRIDYGSAKENAARVESAAAYLGNVSLAPQDMRTTLHANANGKSAYGRSQDRISCLGALLDQEAQNIRELGAAFEEYDEMMGRLWENGSRYPVITAKE